MTRKPPDEILYNAKGQPLCSRKNKQCRKCEHRYSKEEYELINCPECGEDRRCRYAVKHAGDACRQRHGGSSLKGIASPSFKTGRHSKYLPEGLRERYDAAPDERLAALDDELRLIDTRITQLIEKINIDSGFSYFQNVRKTWDDLRRAIQRSDAEATAAAMTTHDEAVKTGFQDAMLWQDIGSWLDRRVRTAATVGKQAQAAREMVSVKEFMLFYLALQSVVRDEVSSRQEIGRIAERMDAIFSRQNLADVIDGEAEEIE